MSGAHAMFAPRAALMIYLRCLILMTCELLAARALGALMMPYAAYAVVATARYAALPFRRAPCHTPDMMSLICRRPRVDTRGAPSADMAAVLPVTHRTLRRYYRSRQAPLCATACAR